VCRVMKLGQALDFTHGLLRIKINDVCVIVIENTKDNKRQFWGLVRWIEGEDEGHEDGKVVLDLTLYGATTAMKLDYVPIV